MHGIIRNIVWEKRNLELRIRLYSVEGAALVVNLPNMPKEVYLDALTTKMQSWRERLGADDNPEVDQKYEHVVDLLTSYERMGAGAWREEERALNAACTDLEQALQRS